MEQREFIVEAEAAGQRIDRFLSGEDTGLSRSALQGLVADGHVLCNGKSIAKSLKLKAGDTILLEIPDAKPIGFHRESTALNDTDMKYLLLYLEETYGDRKSVV